MRVRGLSSWSSPGSVDQKVDPVDALGESSHRNDAMAAKLAKDLGAKADLQDTGEGMAWQPSHEKKAS